MGNCIVHEPHLHWAGEDWGPATAPPEPEPKPTHVRARTGSRTRICTEVKVKITKKQLEELMTKLDAQAGLTVNQVVAQLVKASARYETTNWRPRLHTIPEATSYDSSGGSG